MTTEHDSTISLWSDYCDKKMEVERLHELETAARAEIARLKAFCTELFEHLEYCGWGDAWERECSVDLRKRAHANEEQQP